MLKEILNEQRKQALAEHIIEILRSNGLNQEEIQELFRGGMPQSGDTRVNCSADQIIRLFIEEQLSITEGASVLKAVTNGISKKKNFVFPSK